MAHVTLNREAPAREAHMNASDAVHRVVRVVADGTGRAPQEVWVLGAVSVAVTVTGAATRGVIRLVHWATTLGMGSPSAKHASKRALIG